MPYLSAHGLEVFYRDEGSGEPVVFGHSSTGSGGQWRALSSRLAGRYRLLIPDHIGYGRTGAYSGAVPLIEHERDIILSLIELAGPPVHLVGHSYGGSILTRAAVRMPGKVRSLALIEPTLFYLLRPAGKAIEHAEISAVAEHVIRNVDAAQPREAAHGFIDYWGGPGAFAAMDERLQTSVVKAMPKLALEWRTAFEPSGVSEAALAALDMPILLLGGSKTTAAARGVMDILHRLWPHAPRAEIPGAGHMAPVTHADEVNAALEDFLNGQSARARR